MAEQYYLNPLIFGAIDPKHPFPRLNFKTTKRGQLKIFSRTNYNLFLEPEGAENLSLATFIVKCSWQRVVSDDCHKCIEKEPYCSLFVKSYKDFDVDLEDFTVSQRRIELWGMDEERLAISSCPFLRKLLDMTETQAERKFLAHYLVRAVYQERIYYSPEGEEFDRFQEKADELSQAPEFRGWHIAVKFRRFLENTPALIPQVWLNYIYEPTLGPKDPERKRLQRHPSRVDFIMLWDGKRHVIEIDGPEHYATFQDGQYAISEEQYTKNLRIERSLRHSGWLVHRFSNWEVLQWTDVDFWEAKRELVGLVGEQYLDL